MKLSQLTSLDIQRLSKLIAEREAAALQLARAEEQISAFAMGVGATPRRRGRPPRHAGLLTAISSLTGGGKRGPQKGEKPGRLKGAILNALEAAGNTGLSVTELSEQLNVKTNNLYSWFYTTGKKIQQIKRTDDGKYTYIR